MRQIRKTIYRSAAPVSLALVVIMTVSLSASAGDLAPPGAVVKLKRGEP